MQTLLVANRKGGVGKTMIAVTLASALANRGARVAIADADRQQSALDWVSRRPADAAPITGLGWQKDGEIGKHPKRLDWLVIDAPGALRGGRAADLVAEARALLMPVQPGIFDVNSTRAFLAWIERLKRVRKGKVGVHVIANRVRARSRTAAALQAALDSLGHPALAEISERTVYGDLANQGLGIFDRRTKALDALKAEWHPVLAALGG
ncbi:MAG: ParA family protein [Pseudomonadota bacterium]